MPPNPGPSPLQRALPRVQLPAAEVPERSRPEQPVSAPRLVAARSPPRSAVWHPGQAGPTWAVPAPRGLPLARAVPLYAVPAPCPTAPIVLGVHTAVGLCPAGPTTRNARAASPLCHGRTRRALSL